MYKCYCSRYFISNLFLVLCIKLHAIILIEHYCFTINQQIKIVYWKLSGNGREYQPNLASCGCCSRYVGHVLHHMKRSVREIMLTLTDKYIHFHPGMFSATYIPTSVPVAGMLLTNIDRPCDPANILFTLHISAMVEAIYTTK